MKSGSGIKRAEKSYKQREGEEKTLSPNVTSEVGIKRVCVEGQKNSRYCFNPVSGNLLIPCCEHHRNTLVFLSFAPCYQYLPKKSHIGLVLNQILNMEMKEETDVIITCRIKTKLQRARPFSSQLLFCFSQLSCLNLALKRDC